MSRVAPGPCRGSSGPGSVRQAGPGRPTRVAARPPARPPARAARETAVRFFRPKTSGRAGPQPARGPAREPEPGQTVVKRELEPGGFLPARRPEPAPLADLESAEGPSPTRDDSGGRRPGRRRAPGLRGGACRRACRACRAGSHIRFRFRDRVDTGLHRAGGSFQVPSLRDKSPSH